MKLVLQSIRLTLLCFFIASSTSLLHAQEAMVSSNNVLRFTLLHTNDEHAALIPKPQSDYGLKADQTTGGIARLATLVNQIREQKATQSEPVLLVSGGDFISGSPFSWLILRDYSPELNIMIEVGYDVITLGNHEFDYGPEKLAQYLERVGYPDMALQVPIVATNMQVPAQHPLEKMGIESIHLKRLPNGLMVGFFGLMGINAADVAPMAKPVTFSDRTAAASMAVNQLRQNGADVVIMLSHSGEGEESDIANAVSGIDVIVGGHTHTVLRKPLIVNGTLILQTGTEFQYMGMLEFGFDTESQQLTLLNMPGEDPNDTYLIPIDASIPEDPRIKVLVDDYGSRLSELVSEMTNGVVTSYNQLIAKSDVVLSRSPELSETPLGNFVADAMQREAEAATGKRVDFVFQASGVIRGDLVPSTHPDRMGALSFYDVSSLIGLGSGPDGLPGYPMVSVYFTGEEVRRILEITVLLSNLMGDTYFLQNSRLLVDYDPNRALYFTIPFTNMPIPTGKSILNARMYTGEGRQSKLQQDYVVLNADDQTLYHVVSDYYNASFLPMVGEVLPGFKLVIKDEYGNPATLEDRIVYKNGKEAKVWEAVIGYLMSQPADSTGLPVIDASYSEAEGRWNKVEGDSVVLIPALILGSIVLMLVLIIARLRRHRKQRSTPT
jgi:5'-nucleotidase/UDP-sugar diphosphatase